MGLIRSLILNVLLFVFASNLLAETKKDTLINKVWRDTIRIQKAQVFDTESNGSMLYYKPKPLKFAKMYLPISINWVKLLSPERIYLNWELF